MKTETIPSSLKPPQRISLTSETARSLKEGIRAGHWRHTLPGERELVHRLQVSRQTLRAALEELTREGLLECDSRKRRRILAEKQGPALAASAPRVIALLSSRPLQTLAPSFVVMLDELREHLSQRGYSLEVHVSQACFSPRPARALDRLTHRSSAAAWLLLGSLEALQRWFAERALPCLVIGSCAPGILLPSIDTDYRATCRHAGGMLRRKGHQRIALIRPEEAYGGETGSELGLKEALAAGHPAHLQVLRHDGTAAHVCELLEKTLRSPQPPTACLVGRAHHALTVMMFLLKKGLRIPQDMAVISRDDEAFLNHAVPAVTRYEVNASQFARRLCTATLRLAETGSLPVKDIRLVPRLVRGESL